MIIELDDGRELRVPDSWTDDRARAFAKGFLAGEIDAETISEAERMRDAEQTANPAVLAELKAIRDAVSADRVLVRDSRGNAIASRVRK
jgi:hypothetical protein